MTMDELKIMGVMPITLLILAFLIGCFIPFGKILGALARFTRISYSRSSYFKFDNQVADQDKKSQIDKELYFDPWLPPTLLGQEDTIWKYIKEKHPEIDPKQRNDPLIQLLIRHWASAQIRAEFESIYNFIYGSQIYLLRRINQIGRTWPKSEMDNYFLMIQKEFPDRFKNHKTDAYLEFLLARSLIICQNESYSITPLGIEFLGWLITIGRDENKEF